MKLLLVEDDEALGVATHAALEAAGMRVNWVRRGGDVRSLVTEQEYDAVLLDLGLPDIDGTEVLSQMRQSRLRTPVIVLTARDDVSDMVDVLDLGADDYLVKPVDLTELRARLRAVNRRLATDSDTTDVCRHGPLELTQSTRKVQWHGRPVMLTAKEFDLLEALVLRRPRVVSRRQLEDVLYGWGDEVESNAIEVYVHFLRRKFVSKLVVTVRGKGYKLCEESDLGDTPPPGP